jgi:hypothetical protein
MTIEDFVKEPISAAGVGHMLRPVGKKHVPHESVPPPSLAARELAEVGLRQCFRRRHDRSPSLLVLGSSADEPLPLGESGVATGKGC